MLAVRPQPGSGHGKYNQILPKKLFLE